MVQYFMNFISFVKVVIQISNGDCIYIIFSCYVSFGRLDIVKAVIFYLMFRHTIMLDRFRC